MSLDVTACTSGPGSIVWASGGTYNPAGQLTALSRLQAVGGCSPATPNYTNQGWKYNNLNQVTEIDMAMNPFVTYAFSATQNNGQIQSMLDSRTGNTVSYTYDLLKRVTNASATGGTAWTQAFGYDGFGNLVSKSVPPNSSEFPLPGVNAAKNWINGSTYDPNGNVTTLNNATLGYDIENRLTGYSTNNTLVESYAYDESNRRVEKWTSTTDTIYFYGPSGKLLTVAKVTTSTGSPWASLSTVTNRLYFGKMLLGTSNGYALRCLHRQRPVGLEECVLSLWDRHNRAGRRRRRFRDLLER